ncbi:cytochrome (ubi)quinol oxidase subunit III [uncultured Sphingomonas sp.]|uniref:cytochrome (ubi)quinol oxidase subunit III n=1 Tax=uncultured Sphingomonas sp. TaxID=158754 RepID=UPI00261EA4EE|nr:cytochrome (ubi)quinol oxidase subunit III [uncultured Sphingomonas sp.]
MSDVARDQGGGRADRHPHHDPHRLGRVSTGSGTHGPASKRIVVGYGFWIFLLSDIIMFSAIFATYAVLQSATNGGPTGAQLFDLKNVAVETTCLLLSSFVCGLAMIAASTRSMMWTQIGLLLTGLLGFVFLVLELHELADMVARNAGPQRSAFLSAFFTLVGCHGLHVSVGLLWLGTMMAQIWAKGFTPNIQRRLLCFSLFWHALDIIWVALFTIVYLLGAGQ